MLHVFIGYDAREHAAFEVCAASLRAHTSIPLAIVGLKQDKLRERGIYTRPADEPASTEFAHTRFLVPYLCGYKGTALFVDCDFLFTRDIKSLLDFVRGEQDKVQPVQYGVALVKHDYTPKAAFKMDGQPQVAYPRKNWSSLMLFNNPQCRQLTPEYVNSAKAADLHRFNWIAEHQILGVPQTWNWLEGEYEWESAQPPAGIHYTNGGPWFYNHKSVRFADLWVHAAAEIEAQRANKQ